MAVLVADLLEPSGPIDETFFPDADLTVRLQAYLDRAAAKVASYAGTIADEDAAVRAWALHLAFKALYLLKSNNPNSASMEGLGSTGYATDQREAFKEQADRYEREYYVLAPEVPVLEEGTSAGTHAVRNVFKW